CVSMTSAAAGCKPETIMRIGDISLLAKVLTEDPAAMAALRSVRDLDLPDGWIAAGFPRNRVLSALCGSASAPGGDIDVVYHDAADAQATTDAQHEERLRALLSGAE